MNTIAYLLYGTRPEYQLELTYAVLSARHFIGDRPDYRIVLITDAQTRRDDLPIERLVFTDQQFSQWTRGGLYQHEAKPHALRMALETYGGKLALIDTDTFFTRHPDELFDRVGPGRSCMQAEDGVLGVHPGWADLLNRLPGASNGYAVAAGSTMHNSGVIGMDASDTALIADAVALIASLYAIDPVFNIEQFAFTAVLERYTALTVCPDVIHHYWGTERGFMHAQIGKLFPHFTRAAFDRYVTALPRIGYPKKQLVNQLRARIKAAQRGQGGTYRFAYLAYLSALSSAGRDAPNANAWADIALDFLKKDPFPREQVRRDFVRLLTPESHDWLSAERQRKWHRYWTDSAP